MSKVVVVIPAYNEEDRIAETVHAVMRMPNVDEVYVIDDGSEDRTAAEAYDEGAQIIQLDENVGKGAAMNMAAEKIEADIYLFIDADLGNTASETHLLLEPVLADHADMSIAIMKAPPGHKGGFGFVLKLAKWAIKNYGGADVIAPISGQRAIKRCVIDAIGGFEAGFGVETAMTIDALRKGFRIVEVPLPLTHRVSGRNLKGFIHRGEQFRDILKAVWKRRKD